MEQILAQTVGYPVEITLINNENRRGVVKNFTTELLIIDCINGDVEIILSPAQNILSVRILANIKPAATEKVQDLIKNKIDQLNYIGRNPNYETLFNK